MRIYDGSPRQDFEEVFRSIGAFLDSRGMRDILIVEVPDGFVVQGLVAATTEGGSWSDTMGQVSKETLSFFDDDIAKFMEEAAARRGKGGAPPAMAAAGTFERSLRVIGRWMDAQRPKDVFLFEQGGAYVIRLLETGQAGVHHTLSEFTREDIETLISDGPQLRNKPKPANAGGPIQAVAPMSAGVPPTPAPTAAPAAAPDAPAPEAAASSTWGEPAS